MLRDQRPVLKPAAAVRTMLERLAEDEKCAQNALDRAEEGAQAAALEVAAARAYLDAVRGGLAEWRDFQRQHCE
jgi:hypothetical protein